MWSSSSPKLHWQGQATNPRTHATVSGTPAILAAVAVVEQLTMYPDHDPDSHLSATFAQTVAMGANMARRARCQFCRQDVEALARAHRRNQELLSPAAQAQHKHRCCGSNAFHAVHCPDCVRARAGHGGPGPPAAFCYNCDEYLAACSRHKNSWLTAPGLFDELAPGARICRSCLQDLRGSLLLDLTARNDGALTLNAVGGRALLVITSTDPQPGDNVWTFFTPRSISTWVKVIAFGCFIAESASLAPVANDGYRYHYHEFVDFYTFFLRHWVVACLRSYRLKITHLEHAFDEQQHLLYRHPLMDFRTDDLLDHVLAALQEEWQPK